MTHPGLFSATSESLAAFGCSPLRMGSDSQERCATLRAFNSTSIWCSFAAGEGHSLYLTSLTQVNGFRRERDIHSPMKNLSFLKMTPCLNTSEQLEQISVKLLIIQCIDAALIVNDYGINIFSFLNSVYQNCPEKWLMGFFCSWVWYAGMIHLSEHVNLAELDIQQVVFQSYGQHSYLKQWNLLNLAVPRGCLRFVIVVFPDHTHLLFFMQTHHFRLKFYTQTYLG